MTDITIESGFAAPPEPKRGRPSGYPYATMKIGDSFKLPKHATSPQSVAGNGNTFHSPKRFRVAFCAKRGCLCCWRIK